MKLSLDITGDKETASGLRQFKDEMPRETEVGLAAGLLPIVGAMKDYASRPSTGRVSYVRTGAYGRRISQPKVTRDATGYIGTIDSGAPYSQYLRGTPEGNYLGAWMHRGIWAPLVAILDKFLPRLVEIVQARIDDLIRRVGLGGA